MKKTSQQFFPMKTLVLPPVGQTHRKEIVVLLEILKISPSREILTLKEFSKENILPEHFPNLTLEMSLSAISG